MASELEKERENVLEFMPSYINSGLAARVRAIQFVDALIDAARAEERDRCVRILEQIRDSPLQPIDPGPEDLAIERIRAHEPREEAEGARQGSL